MPHVKELQATYADDGLVVVGVHTQNAKEKVDGFVEEQEISYAVAVDAAGARSTVAAMNVDSFPDYYLIDREGNLRYADLSNGEVDAAIEHLLAEPVPPDVATRGDR